MKRSKHNFRAHNMDKIGAEKFFKSNRQKSKHRTLVVEFTLDPEHWGSYDDVVDELLLDDVLANLARGSGQGISFKIAGWYSQAFDFLKKFYKQLKSAGNDSSYGMTQYIMFDEKESIGEKIKKIISHKK